MIDYLQVDANYNSSTCQDFDWADGTFVYQMDNDVELNAGGPGGLIGEPAPRLERRAQLLPDGGGSSTGTAETGG